MHFTEAKFGTVRKALLVLLCSLSLLFIMGCGSDSESEITSIALTEHAVLAGALNKPLTTGLHFSVQGKAKDSEKIVSMPGVRLAFAVISQPEGADAHFEPTEAVTDAGGTTVIDFIVGDKPGLYHLKATVVDKPDITLTFTVIGGVSIHGDNQDGRVGQRLDKNLVVQLESAPGVFLGLGEGEIGFDLRSDPGGTNVSTTSAHTDANGIASATITLGDTQGLGEIGVTILSGIPGASEATMFLPVHFFAMNPWKMAVSILGGVALFLFGMHMMSDGLQHVAGDKLRAILNVLTRNRFFAVIAGAGVTALIQSSSACTVMVVGFVNAGLMRLEQAIGVIMGANIGTTITAQIISFKLTAFALPAITIGVIITLVARTQKLRFWGSILVGFGILFLGMNIMSSEMGELRSSSWMISLFENLDCTPGESGYIPPFQFFKAVGVGLIVTLVLQSSAATIGLLFIIAGAGLIDPYAAFGILLGDNIGTTITAVLAAIGSGLAARRAACFHVMFNICGVVIMMILNYVAWPGSHGKPVFMYFVNLFTPGDAFSGENLPRFLANAHTLFNISCTIMFLPFVRQFAAMCRFIIKAKDSKEEADDAESRINARRVLEPHLLYTPSLAMQQVWAEVSIMLSKGREAQADGFKAIISTDTPDWDQLAKTVRKLEQETDELQAAVTTYLSNIPLTGMNESQSEMFPRMIRTVNDAERVGDIGRHMSKLGKRVKKRTLPFTEDALTEMQDMARVVDEILQLAEKAVEVNADGIELSGGGAVLRKKFLDDGKRLDKEAKAKSTEYRKNHEKRHELGNCDIRSGVIFMDVVNSLARSAGHALNVIEAACYNPTKKKK